MPKRKQEKQGVPEWVVTYGDLMSLLLCFFILLAAFSELKQPREYRKAIESIQEALGFEGGLGQIINLGNPRNSQINRMRQKASMAGERPSRSDINESNISGRDQTVSRVHEGNRWLIGGTITFEAGSAELTEQGKSKLRDAAEKMRGGSRKVLLRGHAWGMADRSTGLDLKAMSFERARSVERFLIGECDVRSEILLPVAVGDTEPLGTGGSATEAVGQNRRVEIMVTEVQLDELHPDPEWQGTGG